MACRICRRPNHNARSCKKKSRNKLGRKTRAQRRHYRYNPVLEDQELAGGIYSESDSIFDQDTVLSGFNYQGIKHIFLTTTNWDAVAEKLAGPRMRMMVSRAIRKAFQKDPQVDQTFRRLVDNINNAAEEIMLHG